MTTTKPSRVAKNGVPRTVSLDPVSIARLALLERMAAEYFETKSTASTVVRRSLALLENHYETLMNDCREKPYAAGIRGLENMHLDIANAGRDPYGIRVQDVLNASALKPIVDLASEKNADKPRLMEEIRQDLKEWGVM